MIPLILNEYLVGGFNPTPLKNDGVRQLGYVPNHQPGLSYWLNSKRHAELSNIQSKKGNGMQSKMKLFLPKWQDDQSLQFNDVELLNLTIPMDQLRGASAPATGPSTAWPGWAARGAVSARCPVGPATRRATCLDGEGTARDVITGGLRSSKWRIDVAIRCFCNSGYMEIIELE